MFKLNHLNSLSHADLISVRDRCQELIDNYAHKEKAIKAVADLAKQNGVALEDLAVFLKASTRKKSGPVAVRYVDPKNPENTWTGRGKRPTWLTKYLEAGKKIDSFLVK